MNPVKSALLCALFLAPPNIVLAQEDLFFGGFDGRWEGTLTAIPAEQYDQDHGVTVPPNQYAFYVLGKKVRVYYKNKENEWQESKPGAFQIVTHKTNALIFVITSSQDVMDKTGSGGWVESQTFTITHKDKKQLLVAMTQTVNNYLLPADQKTETSHGRFYVFRRGEMTLVE